MKLEHWIRLQTRHSESVLDLGAGLFFSTNMVDPGVKNLAGIEIFEPYVKDAKTRNGTLKIVGDLFDWESLVPKDWRRDTVMLIDTLEHLEKSPGFELLQSLQSKFRRVLVFVPEGTHEQTSDAWGYGNDEYQRHRSKWYCQDLWPAGFHILRDPHFHIRKRVTSKGALFCVWEDAA